ncbi:MAG: 7,8-didemethyl-8-hydroxy-5-deazariboflavin synthase CofG [Acidobacteria bacterium]|nr:7,8-didemethyl-8-hydroxy-5-deazariboflavin synthase CofG [Acidobacteriota bacterium]
MSVAADRRDRFWGRTITYSRKIFIPLTNLCRDTCGYCTFVQSPSSRSARIMTPEEILAIARAGQRAGCKEALFSLGEKPELRYPEAQKALTALGYTRLIDYLRDMCELVLRETGLVPHANPGTLSVEEISLLRPVTGSMGMMLESVSLRLMEKGGAHYGCPDKHPSVRLETLENGGRLKVPFTTGILIGIGETWTERIDTLLAIQEIFEQYGNIQEVIVQNFRAKPDIAMWNQPEPSREDMLRTLATARLLLDGKISLQAPPNLASGDYPSYLGAGLNDWGGISPVTLDHINPEAAWPQISELRRATERMGCQLRERLTVYPRYLARPQEFIAPEMMNHLTAMANPDGLAARQHLS